MKGRVIFISVLVLLLAASYAVADPPVDRGKDSGEITLAGTVASKISYQGRLTDAGGNPLNGNYNLVFQLWDHATAGSQVGSDIVKNNVSVSNSLFTVELDVPQDAFNGQALWLQISVNGQVLSPRQELLPVPYAFYALGAPWAGLTDVPPGFADGVDDVGSGGAHDHWGETWSGSGTGLTLNSSNEDALRVYGGDDGIQVESAAQDGVIIQSAGRDAFSVVNAGTDGLYVKEAGGDGVDVRQADGHGVFVASAGHSGLWVESARYFGVYVASAGDYGMAMSDVGSGVLVESTTGSGMDVMSAGFGVWVDNVSYDGLFVKDADRSGLYVVNAGGNGVYVDNAGEDGVHVGETGGHGVHVDRANGDGVFVAAAGDNGLQVNWAESSGVKAAGGEYGGYFRAAGNGRGVYSEGHIGVRGLSLDGDGIGGWFSATDDDGRGILAEGGPNGHAAHFIGNVVICKQGTNDVVMELGSGLDYAEGFDVSYEGEVTPGTVLVIDPNSPGELAVSSEPYDTKVAGIVAGANGQGSGIRLGVDEFDYDVALAGRVYCNVDATKVGVEPGDLLTTSATLGYAMKVTDHDRAQGAILGKAMERLEQGKRGQILVLVTLQ